MTCTVCQRANLSGGLRCAYCGAYLPQPPEFDLATESASTSDTRLSSGGANAVRTAKRTGILGTLAVLALKAKSLLALLKLGKVALTFGTMLVSIWTYARFYGWRFGAGFVLCIFVHEMGHVIVNWRKGIKQTAPMFIPLMGAVIFIKQFPDDPTVEAESGAGGPAAGLIASFVCLGLGHLTGDPFWLSLAAASFIVNLFNLAPFPPLDGSHMAAAFSPKVWGGVLIALLLWAIKVPSSMLWLLIIVGFVFRLGQADTGRYLLAPPAVRARMAVLYVFLALTLSWGAEQGTSGANPFPRLTAQTSASSGITAVPTTPARRRTRPIDLRPRSSHSAQENDRLNNSVSAWVFRGVVALLAALLWLLTARLLAGAGGRRMGPKDGALVGSMVGAYLLTWATGRLPFLTGGDAWLFLGAYLSATAAALIYAVYQAARNRGRRRGIPPSSAFLRARCLAWAAGGAALVTYWAGNAAPLLPLSLIALVYYVRHPWMPIAALAGLAQSLGDPERALALLDRAITRCTDPESEALMQQHRAELNLPLDRGTAALEAFARRDALLSGESPLVSPLGDLEQHATACALTIRYGDALACCERMLALASQYPRVYAVVELSVRAILVRMALYRGWFDEAAAQATVCLRGLPTTARARSAWLHAQRADALVSLGGDANLQSAREDCEAALKQSREGSVQAYVALVRARLLGHAGDKGGAAREAGRALRLEPNALSGRYWRARLTADTESENQALAALASAFPDDYWGQRARADRDGDTLDTAAIVPPAVIAPLTPAANPWDLSV